MDFYNAKLLPKGLPEIMVQLVPDDIYPDTKVIAYPNKWIAPLGHRGRGLLGYVHYVNLTDSYHIGLYPTMCCSNGGHQYPGTFSFRLWMAMLHTALHEIGHLATRALYDGLPDNPEVDLYVESLADKWATDALARILRADPRLGQPTGALTGYPGVLAYKMRTWGDPKDGRPYKDRIESIMEWRAFHCGAQITIGDIVSKLIHFLEVPGRDELGEEKWLTVRASLRRLVHQAARRLGIERFYVKRGRQYLMFNAGEAEAVYGWLVSRKSVLVDTYGLRWEHSGWELIDGNWEWVELDVPERVPPEQGRLTL